MAFTYQPRGKEATERRANAPLGAYDSYISDRFQAYAVKKGNNWGRPLPPTWENADHYGLDVWCHSKIGPDGNTYLCKRKMLNQPCLCCDEWETAKRQGEDEYAKQIAPYKRVLMWWVDRDKQKEGPKPFVMAAGLDRDFVNLSVDKRSGQLLYVDHPDNGYDLEFNVDGEGMKRKYSAAKIAHQPSPLADDQRQQDEWLQFASDNPLPSILVYYPEDYIRKIFSGGRPKGDDDQKGADRTRTESRRRPSEQEAPARSDDPAPPPARTRINDANESLDGGEPPMRTRPSNAAPAPQQQAPAPAPVTTAPPPATVAPAPQPPAYHRAAPERLARMNRLIASKQLPAGQATVDGWKQRSGVTDLADLEFTMVDKVIAYLEQLPDLPQAPVAPIDPFAAPVNNLHPLPARTEAPAPPTQQPAYQQPPQPAPVYQQPPAQSPTQPSYQAAPAAMPSGSPVGSVGEVSRVPIAAPQQAAPVEDVPRTRIATPRPVANDDDDDLPPSRRGGGAARPVPQNMEPL